MWIMAYADWAGRNTKNLYKIQIIDYVDEETVSEGK